jgi:hypothetical protein
MTRRELLLWGSSTLLPHNFMDISGVWETNLGPLRLKQTGSSVRGTYVTGTLTGSLRENALTFDWTETTSAVGTGTFTFNRAGDAFTGEWRQSNGNKSTWDGQRQVTRPGQSYLVVLEAHWERSLAEPEYSFGQMLKSFFARVPSIEVRQRFVHDEANLRRFLAEAAYLDAPTVLYLSSHGSPQGLSVGGQTIAPTVIGESLKAAQSLRLLHLGSCQLMAGSGPAAIRKAAGRAFPISGYTNSADWAGSAAIDFLYLDLVLSRGVAPAQAVEQTRKMLSIATDKTPAGVPVAPCDLKIL